MSDEPKQGSTPEAELEAWKQQCAAGEISAPDTFKKISNIAVLMSYDMIDKLRFLEQETLKLPEEQIVERVEHMTGFVERLRTAYLSLGETDE